MASFAFNFDITGDEEESVGINPSCAKEQSEQTASTVQGMQSPPLEELCIDSAYPVCEDGVVATVESVSHEDRTVNYYCPEEVHLWVNANRLVPFLLPESSGQDGESSDLVTGVYEGGFQLWECSVDLARWLLGPDGASQLRPGLRVAELGCGGGLPGLCCLRCYRPESVTFQDFNAEVLRAWTMPNCLLNLAANAKESLSAPRVVFIAGSWTSLSAEEAMRGAFDLVLTSETIYNPAYYEQLHSALCHTLSPAGVALVSAKMSYFGVGGSVSEFCEFLAGRGVFDHEVVFRTESAALVRVILRLRRKA